MKKLVAVLLLSTALFSCNKNDLKPTSTEGVIRFTNNSSNPYNLYLDGAGIGSIEGKKFTEKKVSLGTHTVKAIQVSGYLVYPTERTATISIGAKEEKEFVFP